MEIISLKCENCGAPLDISPDKTIIKCSHCLTEYFINRNGNEVKLELFATCPICKLNDKVEKISSINRRTNRVDYDRPSPPSIPQEPIFDLEKPVEPVKPIESDFLNKEIIKEVAKNSIFNTTEYEGLVTFILILLSIAWAYIFFKIMGIKCSIGIAILSFIINVLVYNYYIDKLIIKNKIIKLQKKQYEVAMKEYNVAMKEYDAAMKKYNSAVKEYNEKYDNYLQELNEYPIKYKNWQAACKKWNKLYYCYRDDIVFIPGLSDYAPLIDMDEFLYN